MISYIEYLLSKFIKKARLRSFRNCNINKTSKVCSGTLLYNVTMGKYSDIGYDCCIINTEIGSFCSLGANIRIGGASHSIDWVSTSPVFNMNKDHLKKKFSKHAFLNSGANIIGNDVWIADNVLIKAGVVVGDGAVIAMGSVVTKNIPPFEIWAGNPAKLIRKRFSDDVISELLEIKWWEWSDIKIAENAYLFNDIDAFIHKGRKLRNT